MHTAKFKFKVIFFFRVRCTAHVFSKCFVAVAYNVQTHKKKWRQQKKRTKG